MMVCRRAFSTTASAVVKATVGKALRETGAALKYAAGEEVSALGVLRVWNAGSFRKILCFLWIRCILQHSTSLLASIGYGLPLLSKLRVMCVIHDVINSANFVLSSNVAATIGLGRFSLHYDQV
jgi:hypothetical protein